LWMRQALQLKTFSLLLLYTKLVSFNLMHKALPPHRRYFLKQ
jgi:hypothetical protein